MKVRAVAHASKKPSETRKEYIPAPGSLLLLFGYRTSDFGRGKQQWLGGAGRCVFFAGRTRLFMFYVPIGLFCF